MVLDFLAKVRDAAKLSPKDRYNYFVRKTASFEEVWGLYDEGWAVITDEQGRRSFPFFAKREQAQARCVGRFEGYEPRRIGMAEFLGTWLPGMKRDGVLCGVFPDEEWRSVDVLPDRLRLDLEEELGGEEE